MNIELKNLVCLDTPNLITVLHTYLNRVYGEDNVFIDDDQYIFAVPSDVPEAKRVMLVAHMDTVATTTPKPDEIIISGSILRRKNGVLGADDRCGVYAIMQLVNRTQKDGAPLPFVLFTNYEERGGLGVKSFIQSGIYDTYAERILCMLEFDRKGVDEYVVYSCDIPKPFANILSTFAANKSHGSYSDVADLTRHNKIAHANMSIAYYSQHSHNEWVATDALRMLINRYYHMIHHIHRTVKERFMVTSVWGGYGKAVTYGRDYWKNRGSHQQAGGRQYPTLSQAAKQPEVTKETKEKAEKVLNGQEPTFAVVKAPKANKKMRQAMSEGEKVVYVFSPQFFIASRATKAGVFFIIYAMYEAKFAVQHDFFEAAQLLKRAVLIHLEQMAKENVCSWSELTLASKKIKSETALLPEGGGVACVNK